MQGLANKEMWRREVIDEILILPEHQLHYEIQNMISIKTSYMITHHDSSSCKLYYEQLYFYFRMKKGLGAQNTRTERGKGLSAWKPSHVSFALMSSELPTLCNFLEIQNSQRELHLRQSSQAAIMGRVRTKTVKKSAKVIIERYYPKLTLDFETNKRICDEIAIIASKRLRNKVRAAQCLHCFLKSTF